MAVGSGIIAVLILCMATQASVEGGKADRVKTEDLFIRDPFVVTVESEKIYYMYGTTRAMPDSHGRPCFQCYRSNDLKEWEGPFDVFRPGADFWGTQTYWAPEVHRYRGKYYLLGTFSAPGMLRATQILVSDNPGGPFTPLTDRPITPSGWQCLDGTLFVEKDGRPWIVFCHEWEQTHDGSICALPLTADLKRTDGKPVVLFHASEAPWVAPISEGNYVTDGPFLYRTKDGTLLMLWSSFTKNGYALGVARSESGKVIGPWKQENKPLYDTDGGHGMLFRTFDGRLMLVLHSPNRGATRARFIPVTERNGTLALE